ncbi:MAG: deoxyribodipyrimidine photolyase [Deltaproteobacteria bacterium]|nr:deoxyribodipyrimidine photolyase [Deltaproteobacteria bacterium]
MKSSIPAIRIRAANSAPVNTRGDYVLYWMTAYRRLTWNFSLQRAVEWALELDRALLILEALRCGYEWASDRLHGFILQGVSEHMRRLRRRNILYYPYLEPVHDAGKGLLLTLAGRACLVVTDEFPAFFLPRMIDSASRSIPVLLEQVDSCGLLPLASPDRVFPSAHGFRRFLQKTLPAHLSAPPRADPLRGLRLRKPPPIPREITRRWPMAAAVLPGKEQALLSSLPIDHGVGPGKMRGGPLEAQHLWRLFLEKKLNLYPEKRNEPEQDATSGLSPYLHFGHISSHQIFQELTRREGWTPERLSPQAAGGRSGWWGLSPPAEAFLDELITWRELGFNMCRYEGKYDRYETLPDWALETLEKHRKDRRAHRYTRDELERAATHDPLWNAAQVQLVREGRIHNYLRMLWGKKILEWSPTPRDALEVMIRINNRYALDGRDPNSYSGIFWVLGRYDRPWGPERPIFGKIRYMSSENTARKMRVVDYIRKYSPTSSSL